MTLSQAVATTASRWGWGRALLASVVGGLTWGVASSLVNVSSSALAQQASQVTNGFWADFAWCLVGFLAGFFAAGTGQFWGAVVLGCVGGVLAVVTGIVGYYGTDLLRGVYRSSDDNSAFTHWSWLWGDLRSWLQVGLLAGAAFGLCGAVARRGGPLRAWAAASLPSVFLYPYVVAGWTPTLVLTHVLTSGSPVERAALLLIMVLLATGLVAAVLWLRRSWTGRREAREG